VIIESSVCNSALFGDARLDEKGRLPGSTARASQSITISQLFLDHLGHFVVRGERMPVGDEERQGRSLWSLTQF